MGRLYHVDALPSTFFIRPDGTIEEVVIGGPMAEALLRTRVEFPSSGGGVMFPYLNLFGAAIAVSPLLILLGLYFGSTLSEKAALEARAASPDQLYNLILIGLVAFVIGGRLSYAAQHLNAFTADPRSLISRNLGLFDPFGGAVIAVLAGLIYGQRKEIDPMASTGCPDPDDSL